MSIKPGLKDFRWMAAGAVVLLGVVLLAMYFRNDASPTALLASKARRVDLVNQMRVALASGSEAEKSAVLAITDQDSQKDADEALAATATVDRNRLELDKLLTASGTPEEKELLNQFSSAFTGLQRIDKDLLALAVKNTNLKAYALAFGPAAAALKDMNDALSRIVTANADGPDARQAARLAFGAEIAALHIQTLLAPHIAEESDQKMDALEAAMATEDRDVHKDLDGLAALPLFKGNPDLAAAIATYGKFSEIKVKILALSRENTNVRSLALSLNQKRKALLVCQDDLAALQQAILAEPIPGVTYGVPVNPR